MSKKKVLFVTQEMDPYTVIGEISEKVKNLPQKAYSNDFDVRILMPKFGPINERRHKLHEVVRLSGLNIIVDDEDYPLIIKVASLPGTRMQVYFLDNEEFFSRKSFFTDEDDESVFEDNQERMVFFCKGVFETVKKFGWAPDIIHCHGWFTSLIPAYLKTVYRDEPIFENSTCIYTAYTETFEAHFTPKFKEIASIVGIDEDKDLEPFMDGESVRLNRGAAHYADAVVVGSDDLPEDDMEIITKLDKPVLQYLDEEENIKANYLFYKSFIVEE